MVTNKTVTGNVGYIYSKQRPEGHDTTIEVLNITSFVLYTQNLNQSVLKPASPGITLKSVHINSQELFTTYNQQDQQASMQIF